MADKKERAGLDRRRFLLGAGAGATAVVAATVGVQPAEAYNPGADHTKSLYKETAHVKAFYRTNGYE